MSIRCLAAFSLLPLPLALLAPGCLAAPGDTVDSTPEDAEEQELGSAPQAVSSCAPPALAWAKVFPGSPDGDQYAQSLATDALDDVLIAGYTEPGIDFGGGPLGLDDPGYSPFVVKQSPSGDHLWSKMFRTAQGSGSARGVAADGLDVLVAGRFYGELDLGAGAVTSAGYPGSTADDAFVARLSAGGGLIWSKRLGDASAQKANAVAADKTGNVFVAGELSGTLDFGNGGVLTGSSASDAFIAKLDPSGKHLWSTIFRGAGAGLRTPVTLAVEPNGNVIVGGWFEGSITFSDPAACATAPRGPFSSIGEDMFIAKLDGATGCAIWERRFGSSSEDTIRSVAVRPDGTIVAVGSAGTDIQFDGTWRYPNGRSVVVLKLDSAGHHIGSALIDGAANQVGFGAAIDATGDVLVTGNFANTIGVPGLPSLTAAGNKDIFVAKLDGTTLNGEWQHSFQASGDYVLQTPVGVAAIGSGDAVVAGNFRGTIDLGAGPVTSPWEFDVFVARLPTH